MLNVYEMDFQVAESSWKSFWRLDHCVLSTDIMDKIWNIFSNREILEINQAYFGDSRGIYNVARNNYFTMC